MGTMTAILVIIIAVAAFAAGLTARDAGISVMDYFPSEEPQESEDAMTMSEDTTHETMEEELDDAAMEEDDEVFMEIVGGGMEETEDPPAA